MLDQNTDRSWWMIGSLVVGAAAIAICKIAFPELLNSALDFAKGMIPTGL